MRTFLGFLLFISLHAPQASATWQRLDGRQVTAVDFLSAHSGLASFADPTHTLVFIDGNGTEQGLFAAPAAVTNIVIQDSNIAWATIEGHGLYRGSAKWSIWEQVNASNNLVLIGSTPSVLWLNNSRTLSYTSDGINFIQPPGVDPSDSIIAIDFLDAKALICVGRYFTYHSSDGGNSWNQTTSATEHAASVFADRYHGIVYTGGDQLRRSLDSGSSWQVIVPPMQFAYSAFDGKVIGPHDCSGMFYITNASHPDIIRAENQARVFHLAGTYPDGEYSIHRGWVFNRGQIVYWYDNNGDVSESRDGIDSTLDYSIAPFVTIGVESVIDTICKNVPVNFHLHFGSDICLPVRIDGVSVLRASGTIKAKYNPFTLLDTGSLALSYRRSIAGDDTIILQVSMHSFESTVEEKSTILFVAHNIELLGVLAVNDSLDFGSVYLDVQKTLSLTIANTGCSPFRIDSVSSTNEELFSVGTIASPLVPPGTVTELPVTFKPTHAGKAVESIEIGTSIAHRFLKMTGMGVSSQDAVESEWANRTLNCYPNPADRYLKLSGAPHSPLTIVDLLGRVVMRVPLPDAGQQIDISRLPQGSFVLFSGHEHLSFSIVR